MYGDALLQSQQIERAIPILERAADREGCSGRGTRLARPRLRAGGAIPGGAPASRVAAREDVDGDAHLQLARAFQALGRPADAQKAMAEYQKRHQRTAPSGNAEKTLTPPK